VLYNYFINRINQSKRPVFLKGIRPKAWPKFSPGNALVEGVDENLCRRLNENSGVSGLVCTPSSFGSFLSRKEQAE
jgi:hypothetical protein